MKSDELDGGNLMSSVPSQSLEKRIAELNEQQFFADKAIDDMKVRIAALETRFVPCPEVVGEMLSFDPSPERYIRINVTKNTKGYQYENTVSLTWAEGDGLNELAILLQQADGLARDEIVRREHRDTEGPVSND